MDSAFHCLLGLLLCRCVSTSVTKGELGGPSKSIRLNSTGGAASGRGDSIAVLMSYDPDECRVPREIPREILEAVSSLSSKPRSRLDKQTKFTLVARAERPAPPIITRARFSIPSLSPPDLDLDLFVTTRSDCLCAGTLRYCENMWPWPLPVTVPSPYCCVYASLPEFDMRNTPRLPAAWQRPAVSQ